MTRQQPLALAPPAGTASWGEGPLLDLQTRRSLGSVNFAFLALAAELDQDERLKLISGLPARAVRALGGDDPLRHLCDQLPFALFDLRFGESGFWEEQAVAASSVFDQPLAPATDERLVRFARAATAFAWHLAQARAPGARLALGAAPGTVAALAAIPPASVDGLARRVAPALTARFGVRAYFWRQFAQWAENPTDGALAMLRLLGMQLYGAESAEQQQLQRRPRRLPTQAPRRPTAIR